MKLIITAINKNRDSFGTLHVNYVFVDVKTGERYSYGTCFDEGSHYEADTKQMLKFAKQNATKDE